MQTIQFVLLLVVVAYSQARILPALTPQAIHRAHHHKVVQFDDSTDSPSVNGTDSPWQNVTGSPVNGTDSPSVNGTDSPWQNFTGSPVNVTDLPFLNATDSVSNETPSWPNQNSTDFPVFYNETDAPWSNFTSSPVNVTDFPIFYNETDAPWSNFTSSPVNVTDFPVFYNETDAPWSNFTSSPINSTAFTSSPINSTDFPVFYNETTSYPLVNSTDSTPQQNETLLMNNLLPLLQNLTQLIGEQQKNNQSPQPVVQAGNQGGQTSRLNITLSVALA